MDRLKSSNGAWGNITYTYDGVGNRLTKTEGGSTTNYSYGTYSRVSTAGLANYTYDNNGNTITKGNGTESWSYTYDYNNMMIRATKNSVIQGEYFYDGDGKRIKAKETNTKVYSYIGLSPIYEKDLNASSIIKYFYANGLLIAEMNGLATIYYHHDAYSSTRLTTNGAKVVQFSTNYRPFGPQYSASGSAKVKYAGKREDSPTKLYYMGARYYDPEIGRFTTQDPITSFTEPSTLNRYVYAANNPLRFADPTGLYTGEEEQDSSPSSGSVGDGNPCVDPYGLPCEDSPWDICSLIECPSTTPLPVPPPTSSPAPPSPPPPPDPRQPTTGGPDPCYYNDSCEEDPEQSSQQVAKTGNTQIVTQRSNENGVTGFGSTAIAFGFGQGLPTGCDIQGTMVALGAGLYLWWGEVVPLVEKFGMAGRIIAIVGSVAIGIGSVYVGPTIGSWICPRAIPE